MLTLNRRSVFQAIIVASSIVAFAPGVASARQDSTTTGSPAAAPQSGSAAAKPSALDTLDIFVGLDGSKQPQDLGINANMGVRFSANWGVPLSKNLGLGAQFGAAANLSDAAVHVLDQIEGTSKRTQTYLTFGLFQRSDRKITWGVAYDVLFQSYYDSSTLAQLRAELGYRVMRGSDVGVWLAKGTQGDDAVMGETAVRLDSITQVNGFFRHTWPTQAVTSIWAGVAGGHHNVVWVLPDNSQTDKVFVYGADLHMPLSERFAVTGAANFVTPTSTGTVDAFLGVVFYPGRGKGAMRGTMHQFAPLSTVANNPTFAVNMHR